jgi:hypothetical protein
MSRAVAIMSVVTLLAAVPAFAQEVAPGPGTVEVTIIPGGATFFMSKGAGPEFGNYTYGGALAVNFNRYVGIEGEVGGTVGIVQDLTFRGSTANLKTPNTLTYNGNVVVNATTDWSRDRAVRDGWRRGSDDVRARGTGHQRHADVSHRQCRRRREVVCIQRPVGTACRLPIHPVRSKDDAPDFFSQDTRYGHRVYGAVVINAVR